MSMLLDEAPRGTALGPETYALGGLAPRTGLGDFLRAQVAQGWWSTTAAQLLTRADRQRADEEDRSIYLTEREWRASPEFREGLAWEPGITRGRARFNAAIFDQNRVREDVIARRQAGIAGQALGFSAAMLGGLPTPENFIPFAGPAWRAASILRFGSVGGRALVQAAEAGTVTALVSPLVLASQREFGDEVGVADALLDIAVGTAIGAVLGAGSGTLARWRGRDAALFATQRAHMAAARQLDDAAAALAEGRAPVVDPALEREILRMRGLSEGEAEAELVALRRQVSEAERLREQAERSAAALRRQVDAAGRLADVAPGVEVEVRAGADSALTARVRYEVVEADQLVTSHRLDDFTPDPRFDPRLQIRERDRAAAVQQVRERATRLDPSQLLGSPLGSTGAPIVGPDNLVESGNGRVLSIRLAYREDMAGGRAYRDTLVAQGFAEAAGMREPVLIRRRLTEFDPDTRVRWSDDANRDVIERPSEAEAATADARLLTTEVVARLRPGALDAAANMDFARAFIAELPRSEQPAMTERDGRLTAAGLARIERAVQAAAYGDRRLVATMIESTDEALARLGRVLRSAAPAVLAWRAAVAEGRILPQLDGTHDLAAAALLIRDARARGRPLAELLDLPDDLTGAGPSAATRLWLSLMLDRRANGTAAVVAADTLTARIARGLELAEAAPQAPDMFGNPPPTIRNVLATLHAEERVDLPWLPDGIRDFADPPAPPAGPVAPPEAPAARPGADGRRVPLRDADQADPTGSALRFIDEAMAAVGDRQMAFRFETLDPSLVDRVRTATGRDLAGFDHVMDAAAVRHILRRHGEGGTDVRVRPITPEDIAAVPALIRQAAEIVPARQADGLLFRVPTPDGLIAVIEQVGAGRRRLALRTMHFEKGAGPGAPGSTPRESPPAGRPEREPGPGDDTLAPDLLGDNADAPASRVQADPELALLADAVDELAAAGRLAEADRVTLRQGNEAGDTAAAMADALETAAACMVRAA